MDVVRGDSPTIATVATQLKMCSSLETQAAFYLLFFSLKGQDQKSCLNSKEQEHVRSLLVYLQRKQSMKLQRGLGWVCGTLQCQGCSPHCTLPGVTSTCETLPQQPLSLCGESPGWGSVSLLDLYLHTRFFWLALNSLLLLQLMFRKQS